MMALLPGWRVGPTDTSLLNVNAVAIATIFGLSKPHRRCGGGFAAFALSTRRSAGPASPHRWCGGKPPCRPGRPARQTSPSPGDACLDIILLDAIDFLNSSFSRPSIFRHHRLQREDQPARLPAWQAGLAGWQSNFASSTASLL